MRFRADRSNKLSFCAAGLTFRSLAFGAAVLLAQACTSSSEPGANSTEAGTAGSGATGGFTAGGAGGTADAGRGGSGRGGASGAAGTSGTGGTGTAGASGTGATGGTAGTGGGTGGTAGTGGTGGTGGSGGSAGAGTGGSGGACGTVNAGQGCGPGSQCIGGSCVIPSAGACDVHVPGDYATVQQAITALRAANQKATVCIADGTYSGNLSLDWGTAELTLVGSSPKRVVLDGSVSTPLFGQSPALVRFRGVTITGGVQSYWSIALEDCIIRAQAGTPAVRVMQPDNYPGNANIEVDIDSCDIANAGVPAVEFDFGGATCPVALGADPLFATVENDWIHDSAVGLAFNSSGCSSGGFQAVHNTLFDNTTGFSIDSSTPYVLGTTFVANVIAHSTTGITSNRSATDVNNVVVDDMRDNALWSNTNNYGGLATPGAGYVTGDPKLGVGTPPAPLAGSPLIGAGDPKLVPTLDFFGLPRNGRADIGAVEGP